MMNRFQKPICWIIGAQFLLVLLIALLWTWHSALAGLSALVGGMVAVIGSGFFAWRLFRNMGRRSAKQLVAAMYISEAVKLLGGALVLLVLLRWLHLALLPMLSGLLLAYLIVAPAALYQQIKMVSR